MRLPAALILCLATVAAAQDPDAEFALPAFVPDAGVEAPPAAASAPPLLPAAAPPAIVDQAPPKEPRWNRLSLSLAGVLSGLREFSLGFEAFTGLTFGAPALTGADREVAGWLVVPGLEAQWSRLSGPVCAGSAFCGQRLGGGLGVRVGHAVGNARNDGTVKLRRFLFGALSAQAAYVVVPPAPLTQGTRWGEGVFRLTGGAQLNAGAANSASATGFVVHAGLFVEVLAFNPVGQGVQLGAALGVAF